MQESDVQSIVLLETKQGGNPVFEKYYNRLNEQSKEKNFALVAEYDGKIAGYVFVYPFSQTGLFKNYDFTEIAALTVFDNFKNLRIDDKLLDAAEKIASVYSAIVYLSVKIHDWEILNRCVKRDFIVHKSGVWKENNNGFYCTDCENEDQLVFWLFKNLHQVYTHRFLVNNTSQRPCLKWLHEGKQKVLGSINLDKCQKIKVGDEVVLTNKEENAYVKGVITFKHKYDTIREMLHGEGVNNLLPSCNDDDIEKAVQVYQNIPEFHCVDEYGCVAFGLQIVESKL